MCGCNTCRQVALENAQEQLREYREFIRNLMLMFFGNEEDVCVDKLPELLKQFEENLKSYKKEKS